jgi:integrase
MSSDATDDSDNSAEYRSWGHDMDSLQKIGEEILKKWREKNPQSPRDYPTIEWLTDNGYAHLRWILSEKHGMTTTEFFVLLTSAGGSEGYSWTIEDVATIERIKAYLEDCVECRNWNTSTKRTQRARINQFFGRFKGEYGDDKIIELANDPELDTEVYESFKQVIKDLRRDLKSDDSVYQYMRATHCFVEWLERSNRIVYDPMEGIEEDFNFDLESDSTSLEPTQIEQLWTFAETDEERMLVLGYCIWGIRTRELPAIHIDQITIDVDASYIEFSEGDRKNGRGQVTLMFGLDTLANLIDKRSQNPNWNGYLFPSNKEGKSSMCATQMRRRFKELSRKADVKVDGEVATPKQGRSFYYNIFADAETELIEALEDIAAEQGATDFEAIRDHYLSPDTTRRYRRVFFRRKIQQILPDDAHTEYNSHSNSSFEDFN